MDAAKLLLWFEAQKRHFFEVQKITRFARLALRSTCFSSSSCGFSQFTTKAKICSWTKCFTTLHTNSKMPLMVYHLKHLETTWTCKKYTCFCNLRLDLDQLIILRQNVSSELHIKYIEHVSSTSCPGLLQWALTPMSKPLSLLASP